MQFTQLVLIFFHALVISSCTSATLVSDSKSTQPLEELSKCLEGTTRQGFLSPTTAGDSPCIQETQICMSGHWQGPELFQSCDNFTKSCDGQPHGSVTSGYLQPTSPHGVPCMPATKICLNGNWSGPEVYPSCSEL